MGAPMIEKKCGACKQRKTVSEFYRSRKGYDGYCRACRREKDATRPKVKRAPEYARDYKLQKLYGISQADYDRMLEDQAHVCAICKGVESRVLHGRLAPLVVDHNHVTGAVRSLLCHGCNTRLSAIEDEQFMLLAREYLRNHGYDFTQEKPI